jgi:dolichol-phosphate mannosyltransferase
MTGDHPRPATPPGALLILPVLNEEEHVEPLLAGIARELAGVPHDVVLIDDGSRDATVPLIRRAMRADPRLHLIQRQKTGRGSVRGGALKAGLDWGLAQTRREVFIEMDGDLSHRVEELRTGLGLVASGACDVAIASKYLPGSRIVGRPFGRHLVSFLCGLAVRTVLSRKVRDYSNGYRFYSRRAAQLVADTHIVYQSPIYLSEVLALWLARGLKVREFPSTYVGRREGLSKLRLIDLLKASLAVFEIGWRYHVRGFRPAAIPAGEAPARRDAA